VILALALNGFDLGIFAVYMIATVAVGFLVARRGRTNSKAYFLGDRKLPWYVIATSMVAADVSAEAFIANAGIAYKYGIVIATASWNCWIIYSLLIWIFLPNYLRTGLYTIPELLERRFNGACRVIFSAALLCGYVGALIAGGLYAGGVTLHTMLGPMVEPALHIQPQHQILWGALAFAVVTGAYTIYGGLTSAAWTDFLQIIVLGVAGVLVPILGLHRAGGIVKLVHDNPLRFQIFLPVTHEKFPFTGVFTGFLTVGIWYNCTSQHIVQRALGAKDEWHARMGVVGAGYLHIVTPFFFVLPGFIAFALLPNLKNADESYLSMVQLLIPTGLRGLILAGMAAALMSHLSSVLNSASTLWTMDFYKKLIHPDASETALVRVGQIGGTIILLLGVAIAWYYTFLKQPLYLSVQTVFFFIAPPFAVIFCAGLLWRRANGFGAVTTIFSGFAFTALLAWKFTVLNYYHRALVAWCFCVSVMAIASLLSDPPPLEKVAPVMWSPAYARLPLELRRRYHGIKDFRIWWGLMVGIILAIYGWFLWFRFQHPVPMFGGHK
jgi:SSS family solute:Na+ symporter